MAGLLPHPRSFESGKYMQYSSAFKAFAWDKIPRHSLMLIESEFPKKQELHRKPDFSPASGDFFLRVFP